MSVFGRHTLPCPSCGADCTVSLVHSLHTERSPALREAILEERFQRVTCDHCASTFRVDPELTVLDTHRGQWLAVLPAARSQAWGASETSASVQFERSFGAKAPKVARDLGTSLTPRVVFGWGPCARRC